MAFAQESSATLAIHEGSRFVGASGHDSTGPHLAALWQAFSLLNKETHSDDAYRDVARLIVETTGAATAAILSVTGGTHAEVAAAFGRTLRRGFPYAPVDLRDVPVEGLEQGPTMISVEGADKRTVPTPLRDLCHPRFRSALIVAARTGHRLGGLIVISRRNPVPMSEADRQWLMAIAEALGLSLRLRTLSQLTVAKDAALESACALAQSISGSLDLGVTFRRIAESAARALGDCRCMLLELRPAQEELVAVASSDGADEACLGLRFRFEDEPSVHAALATHRSIAVEDTVWGAAIERNHRESLDFQSALFVPLWTDQDLIGSLLFCSNRRRESYSPMEIARAETLAEQAAGAICNARLFRDLEESEERTRRLMEQLVRLREHQRLTFAAVLHDTTVQTMVAALYEIEALHECSPRTTGAQIERASVRVRQAISDTRSVIWELRPPQLDASSLTAKLDGLVRELADTAIVADVDIDTVPPLSARAATALFVVAHEATQNIRHHSQARRMRISLVTEACAPHLSVVSLCISDDGRGFDPAEVPERRHYGLAMMSEQMALVDGRLTVRSAPGAGTTVTAAVNTQGGSG